MLVFYSEQHMIQYKKSLRKIEYDRKPLGIMQIKYNLSLIIFLCEVIFQIVINSNIFLK